MTGSRQLFEREHGIGALVPFIAVTFPDITIVPIAIRADVNRSDMEKLGRALKSLLNDKTFVLISSDMSHYLSENDALANDRETLSWLETLNADNFKKATDDNTDSGPSFVALSALFDEMGLKPNFSELDHSISSKYGGSREKHDFLHHRFLDNALITRYQVPGDFLITKTLGRAFLDY